MDELSNEAAPPEATAGAATDTEAIRAGVIEAVSTVYDPEIPVNIYELGLVYAIDVSADGHVDVTMTLTTPMCPVAGSLPGEVEMRIREVEGVDDVEVHLVWDPPWHPEMMSEAAKLELGFM